ncbi:hypothetical protein D9M72_551540 [compost metagenome]
MVAVVIEAAVVRAGKDTKILRQAMTACQFHPHRPEILPGIGKRRHQPAPAALIDDRGEMPLRHVPEMGLRAEQARFGCHDAGETPRPVLGQTEIPLRPGKSLRFTLLHPEELSGLMGRGVHRRAAAVEE